LNIQRIAYRKVQVCSEHQKGEAFCCDKDLTLDEIDKQCETAKNEKRLGIHVLRLTSHVLPPPSSTDR